MKKRKPKGFLNFKPFMLAFLLIFSIFLAPSLSADDVIYNSFKQKIMDGSIDLDTDTIKVCLVTSSYTVSQDDHEDYADITNEVANGNGYATEGATLANKAVTKDNTNNLGKFDADDVSWAASTITARGAIIYVDSGTDATSWFICYIDFGANKSSSSGTFTISWHADGIITLGE